MFQIWWDFFGIQICFSLVKYVLDLQCCLHAGEVFVYFVIHKFSLLYHQSMVFYCSLLCCAIFCSVTSLYHHWRIWYFPGNTPENSWWGCAEHFSKSWPRFRTKNVIVLHPFSDLASKKLCHNYLDKNANKIDFLNCEFAYFSFFLIHLELKR